MDNKPFSLGFYGAYFLDRVLRAASSLGESPHDTEAKASDGTR
jgi:hypothetical protein